LTWKYDTQHNDTQHRATLCWVFFVTPCCCAEISRIYVFNFCCAWLALKWNELNKNLSKTGLVTQLFSFESSSQIQSKNMLVKNFEGAKPFCQLSFRQFAISSHWNSGCWPFYQLGSLSFCQPAIASTWHYCQLDISWTCHFVSFPFHQLAVLAFC